MCQKGAYVYLNQNPSVRTVIAYAEEQSTLHGSMRQDSTNSDSNVEERKERGMTQGFQVEVGKGPRVWS